MTLVLAPVVVPGLMYDRSKISIGALAGISESPFKLTQLAVATVQVLETRVTYKFGRAATSELDAIL